MEELDDILGDIDALLDRRTDAIERRTERLLARRRSTSRPPSADRLARIVPLRRRAG